MTRINRRSRLRKSSQHLTRFQVVSLVTGVEIGRPFRDGEEYAKAWFRHRAELLDGCKPFTRCEAFWLLEVSGLGGVPPDCAANSYESQRAALLRLGLELTAQEKAMLAAEAVMEKGEKSNGKK